MISYTRAELSAPRLSLKDQAHLFKRLAFLTNASVTLTEGLHMLRDQATGASAKILTSLAHDIAGGQSLARACGKFPRAFSPFSLSILTVGEASGTLSQNLGYLASELTKKQALRRKIVSAFVYPTVILTATLAIVSFLVLYLFPKITPIFNSLHVDLPLTTKIVMATSIFLQHWGLVVVGCVALVVVGTFIAVRQSSTLHMWFDRALLRVPLIGRIMRLYNVSNASRTLGVLLHSGLELSLALPILSKTVSNSVYRRHCFELSRTVERGERMSVYLQKHPKYFPEIMCHMVAVGERSGSLPQSLLYLCDLYDAEVEDFTKNLATLLEPALMICMGLLVGFIAVSIITPIYGITQNLHT